MAMLALAGYGLCEGDLTRRNPLAEHAAAADGTLLIPATDADRELLDRMEARSQMAQRVAAGELTLLEGAMACAAMDRQSPTFDLARFRRFAPGQTDDERYCRIVSASVAELERGAH